jgi:hypothetical protein
MPTGPEVRRAQQARGIAGSASPVATAPAGSGARAIDGRDLAVRPGEAATAVAQRPQVAAGEITERRARRGANDRSCHG